jgi:hypothetical protein
MLAVATMLGTLLHFKSIRTRPIAVAAAGTAGALVMTSQLDFAERARRFYD